MASRHQDNPCKADVKEKERDVMKEAADNLASVKNTLAAIDDLNKRWEVDLRNYVRFVPSLGILMLEIFLRLFKQSLQRPYVCP